jgi:hypothetical protein
MNKAPKDSGSQSITRAYYAGSAHELAAVSPESILGILSAQFPFALETTQRDAWMVEQRTEGPSQ